MFYFFAFVRLLMLLFIYMYSFWFDLIFFGGGVLFLGFYLVEILSSFFVVFFTTNHTSNETAKLHVWFSNKKYTV